MAGRHPYSELREKLSAEAQARAAAKAAEMREEMDLARLRRTRQFSQQELAKMLEVGQTAIAKLERRGDMYVSTLRRFVEAMGGELRISARFPEGDFDLLPSEEDRRPVVSQFYEWVRFWCPRSGKRDLSDDGFLTNPESDLGEILNADLVPFSRISSTSCLVLLGQPGIGKSVAMRATFEHW